MTTFATRTGKAFIAVFVSFALALSLAGGFSRAYAVTSEEKFAEAEEAFARADEMQTKLNEALAAYDEAVARHDDAVKGMQDAQARIDAAEKRIGELQVQLSARASDMYRNGNVSNGFLDVLLGASSFEEFVTSWDMMSRIASQDARLIQESKDVRLEAQAAREEFTKLEAEAKEQMELSEKVAKEIETRKNELQAEAEKLNAEAVELQAKEEEEAEAARRAKEIADAFDRGEIPQIYGSPDVEGYLFVNPCPNAWTSSGFGWRSYGGGTFHKGTDMAAPSGSPIYAGAAGTVYWSANDGGWNGGAGNWAWIKHGGGLDTKYMHMSVCYVTPGQYVERGQLIGLVGSTGDSTGPHLHFQVEVNGQAVDPNGLFPM